jgi:TRAP-type uncharacterized transport system fused permease subunit
VVTEQQLEKAAAFIAAEEGAHHRFTGPWGHCLFVAAVAMSLYHLYAAYGIVTTTTLRSVHVGFTLALVFLLFPALPRLRHRFSAIDLVCALAGWRPSPGRWPAATIFSTAAPRPARSTT